MPTQFFDSEIDRLEWVIAKVQELIQTVEPIPALSSDEDIWLFLALFSLLHSATMHATGILRLIKHDLTETCTPLLRAIYEVMIETEYLIRVGDPKHNALKMLISAGIEVNETAARESAISSVDKSQAQRQTEEFKQKFPIAYSEVVQQRNKRKFHWSGISRSAMERNASGNHAIYPLLSTQAHGTIAILQNVKITRIEAGYRITFSQGNSAMSNPGFVAFSAGGYLFYIWNFIAKSLGMPILQTPTEEIQE